MTSVHNPVQSLFAALADLHFSANKTALLGVDIQYFDAHKDWGEGRTAKEVGVAHCFDPYFEQIDARIPRIHECWRYFVKSRWKSFTFAPQNGQKTLAMWAGSNWCAG